MADETLTLNQAESHALKRKFVDNGDGTFSELVATTGEGGLGGGGGEEAITAHDVSGTVDVSVAAVSARLRGYSIAEATGAAPAKAIIRDGTDATGVPVCVVSLPNDAFDVIFFPDDLICGDGIFVEVVSGEIEGSVFV